MSEKSLKKNAFYSVLKVFLSLFFPLITFPYASRILLPEGIGKVNFANSIISYFIMIASLGIESYAIREASKIKNDKQALTKFFKEIISINIICCFIAYVLFFVALNLIPKFSDYRNLLLVCSVKIFFSVLGIEWIYICNEDFKYITIRTFFIQLINLLYLFIFVKTKDDIIHYAIFGILTAVGCNVFNFFCVGKYIDIRFHCKLEISKHIKSIIIFFGITLVTSIYTMLDTTMLGFLSNDTQVGYYASSTKLGHMVLSTLTAITTVLMPRLTTYNEKNDEKSFSELVQKSANVLLLFSIPMTVGIILLSNPLILLLSGKNYLPAIPTMITISPILIFISFGSLTGGQILPSIGKEKISFFSYICGAVCNLSVNFLLIPKIGSLGAAVGTVCAESLVTIIQIIYVRKIIFSKQLLKNFIQSLISSVVMGLFIIYITTIVTSIILQLIISIIVGIFIYGFLLFIQNNYYFKFYINKFLNKTRNSIFK